MESLAVIVLAAGFGKRMGSDLPKVVTRTVEKPLIQHVLETASKLSPQKIVVVTGYKREMVTDCIKEGASKGYYSAEPISFVIQTELKGTGDAVKCALSELVDFKGTVIILYGDAPLIREQTLRNLLLIHSTQKATLSLISLKTHTINAYGRIVRDSSGKYIQRVVEAKDCTSEQALINEFNSGMYAVDSSFLAPAVSELKNDNVQKEYYLTDIVDRASKEGQTIASLVSFDDEELQGVNDLYELACANRVLLKRRIRELILNGVVISDPDTVIIDPSVQVAPGASIGPNVQLKGTTKIAKGVVIEGAAWLKDCDVAEGAHIKFSVRAEDSKIGKDASVGPFAHLRAGTILGQACKVGNFVETKKARLANGVKASHLSYLGDCSVGENTNIGAGTITCNYDGYNKFETSIGKDVFIGSDSCLIAPITIEDGATIGAGSVLSKNVAKDSLAFTRPPQVEKAGWSKAKREKNAGKTAKH